MSVTFPLTSRVAITSGELRTRLSTAKISWPAACPHQLPRMGSPATYSARLGTGPRADCKTMPCSRTHSNGSTIIDSTTRSARFIRRCTTAREAGHWLAGCRRLNTDHGAAPRNDEDPPGGRAVLVEGSYCAIWEEPSAWSAHLIVGVNVAPPAFVIRPGWGAKATVGQSLFGRPCDVPASTMAPLLVSLRQAGLILSSAWRWRQPVRNWLRSGPASWS